MKHRHWLLVAAGVALAYSFLFIRLEVNFYPTYGEEDIRAGTVLAVACLASWTALEVVRFLRSGWGGKCECGYSLRGVKCPECGRDQGGGSAG